MIVMQVEVVGFDELKNLYPKDPNFVETWKACKEPITLDKTRWLDYLTQDGMLFKGSQLCIPRSSMRENLIKEKYSGGMVGDFGQDKTLSLLVNIILASIVIGCKEVCAMLSSMSNNQRIQSKYWTLLAISYSIEALGGHKYGFCSWIIEDT